MADFFDLSEEIVKLQDTIYPISNELPISNLAATEIERLLNGKVKYLFFNFCIRPYCILEL
jgi:hypothetical protein